MLTNVMGSTAEDRSTIEFAQRRQRVPKRGELQEADSNSLDELGKKPAWRHTVWFMGIAIMIGAIIGLILGFSAPSIFPPRTAVACGVIAFFTTWVGIKAVDMLISRGSDSSQETVEGSLLHPKKESNGDLPPKDEKPAEKKRYHTSFLSLLWTIGLSVMLAAMMYLIAPTHWLKFVLPVTVTGVWFIAFMCTIGDSYHVSNQGGCFKNSALEHKMKIRSVIFCIGILTCLLFYIYTGGALAMLFPCGMTILAWGTAELFWYSHKYEYRLSDTQFGRDSGGNPVPIRRRMDPDRNPAKNESRWCDNFKKLPQSRSYHRLQPTARDNVRRDSRETMNRLQSELEQSREVQAGMRAALDESLEVQAKMKSRLDLMEKGYLGIMQMMRENQQDSTASVAEVVDLVGGLYERVGQNESTLSRYSSQANSQTSGSSNYRPPTPSFID